jgi:polysaccharide pyruvyl transferase WcaK-like protein
MSHPRELRVTVIGNFSGRNAGDAAILGGLLRDITAAYPDRRLRFDIPTINPGFVRNMYAEYPVRPVSLLPTSLSIKILGVPLVRAVLGAELVLVTDALLFDRRLYNPLVNYLHTLSWVLPWASSRGVPIVLYTVSLGPITTTAGRKCLTRVLRATRKLIVRDRASGRLARELVPDGPQPILAADCALSAPVAPRVSIERIADEHAIFHSGRPVLGFNVNAYLDIYVRDGRAGIRRDTFQRTVAAVLDRAIHDLGVDVLFVTTQVMDWPIVKGILKQVQQRNRVNAIGTPLVTYPEISGILGKVEALIGMRTHSLVLASSMRTPVAGIISYPKSRSYLESIDRAGGALEFSAFSVDTLWNLVRHTWEQRDQLRRQLAFAVERQRAKARAAALELAEWLGPPAAAVKRA